MQLTSTALRAVVGASCTSHGAGFREVPGPARYFGIASVFVGTCVAYHVQKSIGTGVATDHPCGQACTHTYV